MQKEYASSQRWKEAECSLAGLISKHGQTVQSVADAVGVDKQVVMEWICGKIPNAKACTKLAAFLGCDGNAVYTALLQTPCIL